MTITVLDIMRYPVKGLSAEELKEVQLSQGQGIPHDRRFALALASTRFDFLHPEWMPKTCFMMLMRDESLAALKTAFDDATGVFSVYKNGGLMAKGDLATPSGRAAIEDFFAGYMKCADKDRPRLLEAPKNHMFSDHRHRVLSFINKASIAELEKITGAPINPIRFRPNIIIMGAGAWAEFQWLGKKIKIGGACLQVTKRINRCAATNVNPDTSARDMNIPLSLKQEYGHVDMGVYATVLEGGVIASGDEIKIS